MSSSIQKLHNVVAPVWILARSGLVVGALLRRDAVEARPFIGISAVAMFEVIGPGLKVPRLLLLLVLQGREKAKRKKKRAEAEWTRRRTKRMIMIADTMRRMPPSMEPFHP